MEIFKYFCCSHRVIWHENAGPVIRHRDPFHRTVSCAVADLEDMCFQTPVSADWLLLIERYHIPDAQFPLQMDIGKRCDRPSFRIHITDPERAAIDPGTRQILGICSMIGQIIQSCGQPETGRIRSIIIGRRIVDPPCFRVSDKGSCFYSSFDQSIGRNHVFLIIDIHKTDDGNIRAYEQEVCVQPDSKILFSTKVFNIPGFAAVGHDHAPGSICSCGCVYGRQKQHRFPGGGRFT